MLGSTPLPTAPPAAPNVDETSAMRLDLDERTRELASARTRLEHLERQRDEQVRADVQRELERLLRAAATPASQLLTQDALIRADKPVAARDVMIVSRRLVAALEDAGLNPVGAIGSEVTFDPNHHSVLGGSPPRSGDKVLIRTLEMQLRGKTLVKAGVQRPGDR